MWTKSLSDIVSVITHKERIIIKIKGWQKSICCHNTCWPKSNTHVLFFNFPSSLLQGYRKTVMSERWLSYILQNTANLNFVSHSHCSHSIIIRINACFKLHSSSNSRAAQRTDIYHKRHKRIQRTSNSLYKIVNNSISPNPSKNQHLHLTYLKQVEVEHFPVSRKTNLEECSEISVASHVELFMIAWPFKPFKV